MIACSITHYHSQQQTDKGSVGSVGNWSTAGVEPNGRSRVIDYIFTYCVTVFVYYTTTMNKMDL